VRRKREELDKDKKQYLACRGCGHVFFKWHRSFNQCTACLCCHYVEVSSCRRPHGHIWYVGGKRLHDVVVEMHDLWRSFGVSGQFKPDRVVDKIVKYLEKEVKR